LSKIQDEIERGEFRESGEKTFATAMMAYIQGGALDGLSDARKRERKKMLRRLTEHFGNEPLNKIDQAAIESAALLLYPARSAATRNRSVYTPVSAVLHHAGISLNLRRPKGSAGNKQTAWLWPEQAEALFEEAGKIDTEFQALLI